MACAQGILYPNVNGYSLSLTKEPLVGTFSISTRFVKAICARLESSEETSPTDLNCELDSHADTVCAGREFVMFEKPDRHVDVHPYSEEYKPLKDIPITTAATVWTSSKGEHFLLLFHEALFFGDRLEKSLICPNQMRAHGLIVEDVPRQFDRTSSHSIRIPAHNDLTIPLELNGIMSCFATHAPTPEELDELPRIDMTSSARWQPHSDSFADAEESIKVAGTISICKGDPVSMAASSMPRMIAAATSYRDSMQNDNLEIFREEDDFYDRLIKTVTVASDDVAGEGMSGHHDKDVYTTSEEVKQLRKKLNGFRLCRLGTGTRQ